MRFPLDGTLGKEYKLTTLFSPVKHPGIDIAPIPAGNSGVRFYAPERLKVIASGNKPKPQVEGQYLILQGLDSGKYYYAGHFANRYVNQGQVVAEGTHLADLGMTGNADGVHTHLEVRSTPNGSQIDPRSFFAANIKPKEEEVKITQEQARILLFALQGKNGLYDDKNALSGSMDTEIAKYFKGRELGDVLNELWEDKTSKDFRENYQPKANQALKNQTSKPNKLSPGLYQVGG